MLIAIAVLAGLAAAGVLWSITGFWWLLIPGFLGGFALMGGILFLLIWAACALVNTNGSSTDSPFYRWLMIEVTRAIPVILLTRLKKSGLEKLPRQGRFLLVCNHLCDLDPVFLHNAFPKSHLAFVSKRENMDMFLVGKIMHKTLCQMINRENDREALKTILSCVSILKEDKASIAVFPEGYTSMDGLLHPFRSGVFKIALKAQVPVVVCAMKNQDQVFGNAKRLKPTTVELTLVDVIYPRDYEGCTAIELGNRVHKLMADCLGPDKVLPEGKEPEENA